MTVTITFYGHACFKVDNGHESIVLDPYANDKVPGLKLPSEIEASCVSCSHEHADHNAKELIKETIPGKTVFEIEKVTVPHDEANGTLRGMNDITILHVDGKKIVHFGDIGRLPTEEEYAKLANADVVMIPAGGHYTIDARNAKHIVDTIQPNVTILMHYRKGEVGYDVLASIDDIKQVFSNVQERNSSCYILNDDDQGIVITLEPKQ